MVSALKKYNQTLSSALPEITRVEQLIDQLKDDLQLSDDIYGNMLVSVTEAVNNAIVHGNRLDPDKKVHIRLTSDDRYLIFTITDEGKGFDYNNLPDPTAPENLEKPTGRGVFLMKNLSDLVVFNALGNEVEIHFKL